jgi:hypothetical protein
MARATTVPGGPTWALASRLVVCAAPMSSEMTRPAVESRRCPTSGCSWGADVSAARDDEGNEAGGWRHPGLYPAVHGLDHLTPHRP